MTEPRANWHTRHARTRTHKLKRTRRADCEAASVGHDRRRVCTRSSLDGERAKERTRPERRWNDYEKNIINLAPPQLLLAAADRGWYSLHLSLLLLPKPKYSS